MSLFPQIQDIKIEAPGFEDPDETINLGVSSSWLHRNAVAGRRTPLMQFWPLVVGQPPPVNNIGFHEQDLDVPEFQGLLAAHLLYKGIERPIVDIDKGEDIYVFISKPPYTYKFVPHMVCVAKCVPSPPNAVFACYVRRFEAQRGTDEAGIVLSWEWVVADSRNDSSPEDARARYATKIWER